MSSDFDDALAKLERIFEILDTVPEGLGTVIDDYITDGYNELDSARGLLKHVCEWHEELEQETA